MLTAKKSFNIPLFENGRHSNSSGMPAIKKTLWLLPKSFLPLPLAGLEPARCYPLDFESSASANSATAAYSVGQENLLVRISFFYVTISGHIFQLFFYDFICFLFAKFLSNLKTIKCCKIVFRCLCTANHLYTSIFFQEQLC